MVHIAVEGVRHPVRGRYHANGRELNAVRRAKVEIGWSPSLHINVYTFNHCFNACESMIAHTYMYIHTLDLQT